MSGSGTTGVIAASEVAPGFAELGIRAFTTTRAVGSFGTGGDEPVRVVMGRWSALREELRTGGDRLATASQVHGDRVLVHGPGWVGWLRGDAADGHFVGEPGTALAVSVADCVPVFLAHPSGAIALLHSGWRGTAARIIDRAIDVFEQHGMAASELLLHTGPAICGSCYEVSSDVYARLTGRDPGCPLPVDLRALIAAHAHARGVRRITTSPLCTRCDNERFYSHRAGDRERQLSVMISDLRR